MTIDTDIRGPYGLCVTKRHVYGHIYKFTPTYRYNLRGDADDRLVDPIVNYVKRNV